MKNLSFLILLLIINILEIKGVKVVSTESTVVDNDSHFTIENLKSFDYKEYTLCLRFMTYQFYSSNNENKIQFLLALPELAFEYGIFKYCKNNNNDDCIHGLTNNWESYKWNTLCLKGSKNFTYIYVNNKIWRTLLHKPSLNSGLIFMNNGTKTNPMNGAMSDVTVWNRALDEEEMKKWSQCNSVNKNLTLSWQKADITMNKLRLSDKPFDEFCQGNERKYKAFNLKYDFFESSTFCTRYGKYATSTDFQTASKIKAVADETFNGTCKGMFTGYTDMYGEGRWVEYKTMKDLAWNDSWYDGYPSNSSVTSERCSLLIFEALKTFDFPCSETIANNWGCAICEISEQFMLKGVSYPIDNYYYLSR